MLPDGEGGPEDIKLRAEAQRAADALHVLGHGELVHEHLARGGLQHAADHADRGGLARAVVAQQRGDL
eukprot:scaffold3596_cov316-Prasinococcus_capsulatus_cf.AAC.5